MGKSLDSKTSLYRQTVRDASEMSEQFGEQSDSVWLVDLGKTSFDIKTVCDSFDSFDRKKRI